MALSSQEIGLAFPDLLTSWTEYYRRENGVETPAWWAVCLRGRRVALVWCESLSCYLLDMKLPHPGAHL